MMAGRNQECAGDGRGRTNGECLAPHAADVSVRGQAPSGPGKLRVCHGSCVTVTVHANGCCLVVKMATIARGTSSIFIMHLFLIRTHSPGPLPLIRSRVVIGKVAQLALAHHPPQLRFVLLDAARLLHFHSLLPDQVSPSPLLTRFICRLSFLNAFFPQLPRL